MSPALANRLWDAILLFATSCGGDPSAYVYGNVERQKAVADIHLVVTDIEKAAIAAFADCQGRHP